MYRVDTVLLEGHAGHVSDAGQRGGWLGGQRAPEERLHRFRGRRAGRGRAGPLKERVVRRPAHVREQERLQSHH